MIKRKMINIYKDFKISNYFRGNINYREDYLCIENRNF